MTSAAAIFLLSHHQHTIRVLPAINSLPKKTKANSNNQLYYFILHVQDSV